MWRKALIAILAISLLAAFAYAGGKAETGGKATAAAGDPFGAYSSTLSMKIGKQVEPTWKYPEGDSPENNIYSRYLAKTLNIDVKNSWQAGSQADYFQKVNLCIAANDLPDGLGIITVQHLKAMVNADEVADLTDAFNKYASPPMKAMFDKSGGQAAKAVTFGGKMYAIPNIAVPDDGYHLAWIRKDWLDKLGLQPPKTLDDLEAVAKAFVDKDPGGNGPGNTVGISGPQNGGKLYATFLESTSNSFGFDPIFSALHSYPAYWLKGSDGKVVYGSILPETKTALDKLADWYAKGLIDREMGVQKDATQPIVSGRAGIFFGPWWVGYWPFPDAFKNNPDANWQAYAIPVDSSGKWSPHIGMTAGNQFSVIRKGYSNPEALVKMLNCLIRDEGTFDQKTATIGDYPLRVPMAMPDECPVTINAMKDVLAGKKKPTDFDTPDYRVYKLLLSDVNAIEGVKKPPIDNYESMYWDKSNSSFPRMFSLMVGSATIYKQSASKVESVLWTQTKTMETKWATLKKLEDETFLKIIMGAAPVSTFDTFVKDWKAQGGDQVTAEVQAEADRK
ncbi:MAG: extracellular solute-binding protein [Spirochaetia bacterium]|jgi:putative aldouronate transport system substrate-binding protein